jgi:hypothetical protein
LDGPITDYPWAEGIALMTTFVMFFIELLASRFQLFGDPNLEAADPAMDLIRGSEFKDDNGSDDVEPQESEQDPRGYGCDLLNGASGTSKSTEFLRLFFLTGCELQGFFHSVINRMEVLSSSRDVLMA